MSGEEALRGTTPVAVIHSLREKCLECLANRDHQAARLHKQKLEDFKSVLKRRLDVNQDLSRSLESFRERLLAVHEKRRQANMNGNMQHLEEKQTNTLAGFDQQVGKLLSPGKQEVAKLEMWTKEAADAYSNFVQGIEQRKAEVDTISARMLAEVDPGMQFSEDEATMLGTVMQAQLKRFHREEAFLTDLLNIEEERHRLIISHERKFLCLSELIEGLGCQRLGKQIGTKESFARMVMEQVEIRGNQLTEEIKKSLMRGSNTLEMDLQSEMKKMQGEENKYLQEIEDAKEAQNTAFAELLETQRAAEHSYNEWKRGADVLWASFASISIQ